MRNRPTALLASGAVLLVSACTSSGDNATHASPTPPPSPSRSTLPAVDVCGAIDASVLSLALGQRFDKGKPTPATTSTMGQCDFVAADAGTAAIKHVYIGARPLSAYAQLSTFHPTHPVPGLGAGAVFGAEVGLLVKVPGKDYVLQITAADATGDFVQAQAVAIARASLGRL